MIIFFFGAGVNVDAAFFAVAQLIDKTRGRSRILSYYEAAHYRREQLDIAKETFLRWNYLSFKRFFVVYCNLDDISRLIRLHVTDYGVLWSTALKKLCQYQEYQVYTDLFGRESAHRLFQRHVKALKEEYLRWALPFSFVGADDSWKAKMPKKPLVIFVMLR